MKSRDIALTALFAALTAICAQITVPLPLVPITLQTLAVIMSGLLLGPALGALSQLVYILLGAAGLPVFAGFTGGASALVGPTGGFLVAFIPAAAIAGALGRSSRDRGYWRFAFAALAATAAVYAVGLPWLMSVAHLSMATALKVGLLPFIPGDTAKLLLAAYLSRLIRARLLPLEAGRPRSS